ncbi:MAG: hypothetical protein GEU77_03885 [Deltaproteobacteria bacterium]|nr:hypothetical protein [Deltaproteobacteria bacterium]
MEPDAEGDARFDQQNKKGKLKNQRFHAKVKIPVDPALLLTLIDAAAAQSADVQLNLSNGTTGATPTPPASWTSRRLRRNSTTA